MRRPHGGHVLGASPQIPFADDLSARPGDIVCPQDQLLDLRMVQSWYQSGALKGGLWLPDWAYQEQSAGTAVTAAGQVVGVWAPAASSYSASQTTTANKPLTALTPVTRKPWLNADSTDVLPVVFPTSLGSACTIARATPTGVTFDEAQTISATWNYLIRPYQFNSAALVSDRQLTAREKTVVSRVLGAYVPALSSELITNTALNDITGWERIGGSTYLTDVSVSNNTIIVNTTVASNSGIATRLQVPATSEIIIFKATLSNQSSGAQPYYIRCGSTMTSKADAAGDDVVAAGFAKPAGVNTFVFYNAGKPWIKFFTLAGIGNTINVSNPSAKMIL